MTNEKILKKPKEIDLIKRLKIKYSPPDYAFLSHVRNQTGYGLDDGIRTADGLAMGLWPSKGIDLTGFEIKVSRSDFLSEINQPNKSKAISKYCDYWFIVAPKGMVKPEELPDTWGLLEPWINGLKIIKQGDKIKSKPITRNFLASIFRSLTTGIVLKSEVQSMVKEQLGDKLQSKEWEANKRIRDCERNEERVRKFEKIVGKKIEHLWGVDVEDNAIALQIVLKGKSGEYRDELLELRVKALRIAEEIEKKMKPN